MFAMMSSVTMSSDPGVSRRHGYSEEIGFASTSRRIKLGGTLANIQTSTTTIPVIEITKKNKGGGP